MTNLLLGKFDLHVLALGINNTSNLSGAQRVQMKCGPQPKYTASDLEFIIPTGVDTNVCPTSKLEGTSLR